MPIARLVNSGLIPLPVGAQSRRNRSKTHQVHAVLAPADVKGQQSKESKSSQPGQSRGFAGALLSAFKALEREREQYIHLQDVVKRAAERANEVSSQFRSFLASSRPGETPLLVDSLSFPYAIVYIINRMGGGFKK